jgi:hypothetical protein
MLKPDKYLEIVNCLIIQYCRRLIVILIYCSPSLRRYGEGVRGLEVATGSPPQAGEVLNLLLSP